MPLQRIADSLDWFKKNFFEPREVMFPKHLYIPKDAEPLDIKDLCELAPNMSDFGTLMTLKANKAEQIVITHYAVWTDAEDANEIEFRFDIENNPLYRLHGRPNSPTDPTKYTINLGISPDLSNLALVPAYAVVSPEKYLRVRVINRATDSVDIRPVGVRLVGYSESIGRRSQGVIR